ncbi:hypothetical protein [Arsukibacterium sp.]|uniref:hypothetical protein n=2 Tax=Arsukibacterium sp. TaxID=1977258 RepID=UPI001BD5D1E2|nr:hypothetical protein [Arsukibacterium sp.]
MPNKLLNFVPATKRVASTGLPTLRCGSPLVMRYIFLEISTSMKFKWIFASLIIISGCSTTSNLNEDFCVKNECSKQTQVAFEKFKKHKNYKAFAFGKSENGEVFGFSYDYKSQKAANMRALLECQNRVDALKADVKCVVIKK